MAHQPCQRGSSGKERIPVFPRTASGAFTVGADSHGHERRPLEPIIEISFESAVCLERGVLAGNRDKGQIKRRVFAQCAAEGEWCKHVRPSIRTSGFELAASELCGIRQGGIIGASHRNDGVVGRCAASVFGEQIRLVEQVDVTRCRYHDRRIFDPA